jgi:hypothetical protein
MDNYMVFSIFLPSSTLGEMSESLSISKGNASINTRALELEYGQDSMGKR